MKKWDILKKFVQSHPRKIIIGTPIIFLALLNVTGYLSDNIFFYTTENNFPVVGDEIPVMLQVSTKEHVNAVGGTINFSPEILNVASISRVTSLVDLWVEEPSYSNSTGTLRFSGGFLGTKGQNPLQGTIITVNFSVRKEGKTSLTLKDGQILANDGVGTNVISESKTLTLYARKQGTPSPDVNGDGVLSFTDVNTLYFGTFRSYNPRYDLNGDGKTNWGDVSHLISLL